MAHHIDDLMIDLKKKENTPLYQDELAGKDVMCPAYLDEVSGKWHIAFGHLLEQEQHEAELNAMGIEDELDDWKGFEINLHAANLLLEIDIHEAVESLTRTFGEELVNSLTQDRYTALVGMAYQMGSVDRFKKMCGYIRAGDWAKAADEIEWSDGEKKVRRSAFYKQTKDRCIKAANAVRHGYFEKDPVVAIAESIEQTEEQKYTHKALQRIDENIQTMDAKLDRIIAFLQEK